MVYLVADGGQIVFVARAPDGNELGDSPMVKNAEYSDAQRKFGDGSLLVTDAQFVWEKSLADDQWRDIFGGQIDKMTMALWLFLPEEASTDGVRFFAREGAPEAHGSFFFRLLSKGYPYPYFSAHYAPDEAGGATGENTSQPRAMVPVGQWTHLAMIFDEGVMTFYIDGMELHTATMSRPSFPAQGEEDVQKHKINTFVMPPGTHVEDFVFLSSEALSTEALDTLMNEGLKTFLEKRGVQ